jgi:hypothetical protein
MLSSSFKIDQIVVRILALAFTAIASSCTPVEKVNSRTQSAYSDCSASSESCEDKKSKSETSLEKFAISAPTTGEIGLAVLIEWEKMPDAVAYDLLVSNDIKCNNAIYEVNKLKGTSQELTFVIPQIYYVCVAAIDRDGKKFSASNNGLSIKVEAKELIAGSFAASTSITSSGFTLNWTSAYDDRTASSDLEYYVCSGANTAAIDSVSKCKAQTQEMNWIANTLTFTLSGKAVNTTFYYNAIVRDADGNEALYNGLSQATTADTSAPTPGTFSASTSVDHAGFTLNWSASTDNVTSGASLEYLLCSGGSAAAIDIVSECEDATVEMAYAPNTLTFVVSGKSPGTKYYYNVVVKDQAGNKAIYEAKEENPNRWAPISTTSDPSARRMHTGAWTGSTGNSATENRLIVWGGITTTDNADTTNTGGIYHAPTDTWQSMSTVSAPTARRWQNNIPIWTGATGESTTAHRMIVWGGADTTGASLGSGGIYNPATDTWTAMATAGETARDQFTAIWTGATGDADTRDRMIVWGATGSAPGIYNMRTDSWSDGSATGAPSSRTYATAVWTGATGNASSANRMIVWGGWPVTSDGGIYDPKTDTWTPMTTTGAPSARRWHTAVWTGSKMIVYGGLNGSSAQQNDGGIYDPLTDTWTSIASTPGFGMQSMTSFWTGTTAAIVHWNEIRFFNPTSMTWTTYPNMNGVKGVVRYGASFWTGTNFIMWGGEGPLGEGSIFYP